MPAVDVPESLLDEKDFFPSLHVVQVPDQFRRLQMHRPYLKHKQDSREYLNNENSQSLSPGSFRQTKVKLTCGRSTKLRYHVKLCTTKFCPENQNNPYRGQVFPKAFLSKTNVSRALSLKSLQTTNNAQHTLSVSLARA